MNSTSHILLVATLLIAPQAGIASGLDHRIGYDDSGIWSPTSQRVMLGSLFLAEAGGALWLGGETRLGRTLWQSMDATLVGGVTAYALKFAFSRVRPVDSPDSNLWFKGHGNDSFPSGEVTLTSALVTPLVLEYGHDHPWVYGLEVLPVYDGIARMKVWGHWQTDVIAGGNDRLKARGIVLLLRPSLPPQVQYSPRYASA